MNLRGRNLLIAGLLVIVAVLVAYYLLLLGPLLGRMEERAEQREAREQELANVQGDVDELEAVRDNAPEIERQLLELSKRIPTQPEIPTLAVQVEEVADQAGVTWIGLDPGTPGSPAGGGNYSVVPITMSFEGTYEQLQDFLLRTRNLVRLVTVNDVTFEPAPQESTVQQGIERTLRVEIEAEVYFQPSVEPSDVPAGEAPPAPPPPETDEPEEDTSAG